MDQILFIFLKCVFDFISFFRLFVCFIEMMFKWFFNVVFKHVFLVFVHLFWKQCIFYKQIKKIWALTNPLHTHHWKSHEKSQVITNWMNSVWFSKQKQWNIVKKNHNQLQNLWAFYGCCLKMFSLGITYVFILFYVTCMLFNEYVTVMFFIFEWFCIFVFWHLQKHYRNKIKKWQNEKYKNKHKYMFFNEHTTFWKSSKCLFKKYENSFCLMSFDDFLNCFCIFVLLSDFKK